MVVNILYFIVQLGDIIVNFDLVVVNILYVIVQLGNTIVNFGIDGVFEVIVFLLNLL